MLRKRNPPRRLAVALERAERRLRPGVRRRKHSRNQLIHRAVFESHADFFSGRRFWTSKRRAVREKERGKAGCCDLEGATGNWISIAKQDWTWQNRALTIEFSSIRFDSMVEGMWIRDELMSHQLSFMNRH
jgi:hypothetical protein